MTRPTLQELSDGIFNKELNSILNNAKKTNRNNLIISLVIVIGIFFALFNYLPSEYNAIILIIGVTTTITAYFLVSISNMIFILIQTNNMSEYFEKYNLYNLETINSKLDLLNLNK